MGAVFALGILGLLLFVGFLFIVGIILLIVGFVVKAHQKKKPVPGKAHIVLFVFAGLFLALPALMLVALLAGVIKERIDDKTIMGKSVIAGEYDKVEKFLDKGVEVDSTKNSNKKAKDGEFTLLCEIVDHGFETYDGKLSIAIQKKDYIEEQVEIEKLLLDNGADPNYRVGLQENDTEHPHTSDELGGAKPTNGHHSCGKTPLLLAVRRGDIESAKLLVKYGADITAVDDCGYNAVLVAASVLNGDEGYEMLQFLIEEGCEVNLSNNFGQNALDVLDAQEEIYKDSAYPFDYSRMRELLKEHME